MNHLRPPAVVLVAALATAGASAGASPSFAGKVCGLVPARSATAIPGISPRCTNAPPSRGPGSTLSTGNWAGKTPGSGLQLTIALYADKGALQLATRNLNQGLPGAPRKVTGIGSAAFEGSGASAVGIHFVVGKYVAYVTLNTTGKAQRTSLEAFAKAVAARL